MIPIHSDAKSRRELHSRPHEGEAAPSRCSIVFEIILAVLLLLPGVGCAANRPALTCPKKGGPAWTEIRSAHFRVKTDLSERDGKQIAVDLETTRAALLAAMSAPPDDAATPVEVVVFGREVDFSAVFGHPGASGAFARRLPGDVELSRIIVLFAGLSYETRRALQHELTHEILHRRTGQLPWWLDEGLSEVYSTLRVESEGVAIVGEPPADVDFWEAAYRLEEQAVRKVSKIWLPHRTAPDLDKLLGATRSSILTDPTVYYAAAWKLVHVLRGHANQAYRPRFSAMISDLMKGTDGRAAFARAYKGILLSEIEDGYRRMLLDPRETPRRLEFQVPADIHPLAVAMTDADVHAVWARISTAKKGDGTSPEEQLTQGLAESPGAPPLLYVRAAMSFQRDQMAGSRKDIRLLLQADPENPQYLLLELLDTYVSWIRAGRSGGASAERDHVSALADKLLAVACSAAQRYQTALMLAGLGRVGDALVLSEKAVRLDPSCSECFEAHATVLLENGLPREAKAAIERAIRLLPDGASSPRMETVLERAQKELERVSAKCESPQQARAAGCLEPE